MKSASFILLAGIVASGSSCLIHKEKFLATECLAQNHCIRNAAGEPQCEAGYSWKDPSRPEDLECCLDHASVVCDEVSLYWANACGARQGQKEACCDGCAGDTCNAPTSNASFACDDGDVYWFDSCGGRETVKEICCDGCTGSACDAPTSHVSSACDSGDVYWFDSCGGREEVKQDCCGGGCAGAACTGIVSHATFACFSGDVHWLDSCGNVEEAKEDCCGAGCSGGTCSPAIAHASFACDLGNVYWFDSCGARQEVKETCCAGCLGTTCTLATSHASYACDAGDVYWFDSCAQREDLKQDCGGAGCTSQACDTPSSHMLHCTTATGVPCGTIADSPNLTPSSAFTVEAWVYFYESGTTTEVVNKWEDNSDESWLLDGCLEWNFRQRLCRWCAGYSHRMDACAL